ncbi:MAG: pyridoxamine 5'-phosphate oxidase family protein [Chloroflexota bacterium]
MNKLTQPMQEIIHNYSAGSVATVNDDGTPAVSPKATFVVINDECIAFGNIRSPKTVANILVRPAVEVNFIDVLTRRAVRVAGYAEVVDKTSAQGQALMPTFMALWEPYVADMENFVSIALTRAELILSPAYDVGYTQEELFQTNLIKLTKLSNSR